MPKRNVLISADFTKLEYKFIEKNKIYENKDLTFTLNDGIDLVSKVLINEEALDNTDYLIDINKSTITLKNEYLKDVVNMNSGQPPMNQGDSIDWNAGINADGNTALMYLFGRESIGTLSLKLNKLNSDSDLYVKQEETTNTGGTAEKANKVVRLGDNGKLNENMLPSIAINEYFENGDVVVVTGSGADRGKRFLCVNKKDNLGNLVDGFVELNSKDGIVKSVNGKIGEVNLELEATANELKLKIRSGNDTTSIAETSVPVITDNDIDSIIEGLRD